MHNFRVYWISLYMFWTVFPSIIRSSRLYTQHQVYVIQFSWLFASGHEMERYFHLVPASKESTNLYYIYLMLCVQSWTPDDGRKDRPKHVEWYLINSKIVHLVGFAIEIHHDARFHERQSRTCLLADEIMLNSRSKMKLPKLCFAVDMTFRISRLYTSPRIERRT